MLIMSCSKRALLLLSDESVGATDGGRDFAVADSSADIQTYEVTMLHRYCGINSVRYITM